MTLEGLPHSEIPGSMPVCGSPGLIAACHVLHRFSAPRHPPSTLSSLTIKYLRRESLQISTLASLVKDRDHRGSKSPPLPPGSYLIRAATNLMSQTPPDGAELVELTGIEPATYGLQSRRSPS
jgi:hypothetical protein